MIKMPKEYEYNRTERRSFGCTNKLWKELEKETNQIISISEFIKSAITEKLIRLNPKKKDYYESLRRYRT